MADRIGVPVETETKGIPMSFFFRNVATVFLKLQRTARDEVI